ncbi:MAG: hypothetical protein UR68_C0002G0040 [Candidatus Roizmanbacteria bacterium GW2011_GWA2_35_19]|uniref:POTRA domain-containing protein n=1 Tax=Candidatus Roizmanbacteria bacterium GW2011_GWA2_35_19 TaxID=1618478 RepID=A0A0G0F340_9BACT|nr:MAG: hypothetical protein UR68_C0002G0040 [Candidatus Roizmanbacteria bacterium GW2011_GWA2_35_19]
MKLNISGLEELNNKNILLINIKKTEELLIKINPQIKKLTVKKNYPSHQLPKINYYQKLNYFSFLPGDFIKYEDIKSGLFFLRFLKDSGLQVNDLDIADFDMLLFNVGDKKIIFTTLKNKEKQIIEAESILHQFKIEGKYWQSIDMRFDKPIVKF